MTKIPVQLAEKLPSEPYVLMSRVYEDVVLRKMSVSRAAKKHGLDEWTVRVICRGWAPHTGWCTRP